LLLSLILPALIVVSISVVSIAGNPPQHLNCTCIQKGDHTGLTIQRALCDELADFQGYRHGILIPTNSEEVASLCRVCVQGVQLYECKGVGVKESP
jgi:hypothetical protein